MKMTDGTRTIVIEIRRWNGTGYDPDWSMDYFGAGSMAYNVDADCYIVQDVQYCIDMAKSASEDGACYRKLNGDIVRDNDMQVFVWDV